MVARCNSHLTAQNAHHRIQARYIRTGTIPFPRVDFSKKLPPRSTAGQLTLDQHIGVRIPGGQPNLLNRLLRLQYLLAPENVP